MPVVPALLYLFPAVARNTEFKSITFVSVLKSFHPEVSKMGSSFSEFEHSNCCKQGLELKLNNRMANIVDPD